MAGVSRETPSFGSLKSEKIAPLATLAERGIIRGIIEDVLPWVQGSRPAVSRETPRGGREREGQPSPRWKPVGSKLREDKIKTVFHVKHQQGGGRTRKPALVLLEAGR